MKLVVADTGPLNYLVQIGQIDVLQSLFSNVIVPQSVLDECCHPGAPDSVNAFGQTPPSWIRGVSLKERSIPDHPRLSRTDLEAVLLARESGGILLMDDAEGRREATSSGVVCMGTLGILAAAAERGLLSFAEAAEQLQKTNIRLPDSVLEEYLKRFSF
jgi:predicted nucleic acid-binding protein